MAYDVGKRPATWLWRQVAKKKRRGLALAALFAIMIPIIAALWIGHHHAATSILSIVVILASLVLWNLPDELGDDYDRWHLGASAEEAIGELLNQLRSEGFIVMHDIPQEFEGNIDHLVSGPTGVFMIESKAKSYAEKAPTKAKRQAKKLREELGAEWVEPLICLNKRDRKPFQHEGVWIVPKQHLLDWIRAQREPKVPFERLALWADKL